MTRVVPVTPIIGVVGVATAHEGALRRRLTTTPRACTRAPETAALDALLVDASAAPIVVPVVVATTTRDVLEEPRKVSYGADANGAAYRAVMARFSPAIFDIAPVMGRTQLREHKVARAGRTLSLA